MKAESFFCNGWNINWDFVIKILSLYLSLNNDNINNNNNKNNNNINNNNNNNNNNRLQGGGVGRMVHGQNFRANGNIFIYFNVLIFYKSQS